MPRSKLYQLLQSGHSYSNTSLKQIPSLRRHESSNKAALKSTARFLRTRWPSLIPASMLHTKYDWESADSCGSSLSSSVVAKNFSNHLRNVVCDGRRRGKARRLD